MAVGSRKPAKRSSSLRIRAQPKSKDKLIVDKWANRKFSDERLERINRTKRDIFTDIIQSRVKTICATAEDMLADAKRQNATIIFIGQGMRPLFEAARGLNEINRTIPRKNLRYLVTPKIFEPFLKHKTRFESKIKEIIADKKVVPKGKRNVFVVDFVSFGRTLEAAKQAIESINSESIIYTLSSEDSRFGLGITAADRLPRPTKKQSITGDLQEAPFSELNKDTYLVFQKLLQEYIDKLKRQNEKIA